MENKEKREKFIKGLKQEKTTKKGIVGATMGLATALGVTAMVGCGQKETLPPILPEKKPAIEKQNTDYVQIVPSLTKIEKTIKEKANGEVLKFLKNEYIEQYEKKMGESELTTENIKFNVSYQDYVYVDTKTGEMITHGEKPYDTMAMLEREGISYETKQNVKVYELHYDGKIMDAMALKIDPVRDEMGNPILDENGKMKKEIIPVKVTMGGLRYQPFEASTLMEMGEVIAKGITYAENIENEATAEITKAAFVEAFQQWKEKEEQNLVIQKDEGYEIGD